MNNMLEEFEELLLDNTLLKVQNQTWEIEIPSGRNGGKLFRSSRRSIFKTIWS
jgi:hypothetical protein